MCSQHTLNIDGNQVTSEKSVKLLGINIMTNYVSISMFPHYVKKQVINAISRLHKYLGFKEKEALCRPPWLADEENFRFQMV